MALSSAYDPTRAAELFRRLGYQAQLVLRREYPHADRQQVADAVVDAVMRLASSVLPDVELSLYRIARSRLRTRHRSEVRRQIREMCVGAGDVVAAAAVNSPSVLEELAERELFSRWRDRLARTDDEKAVLECWLSGPSNPADLSHQTGLSEKDVRTILNRFRQRLLRERQRGEEER